MPTPISTGDRADIRWESFAPGQRLDDLPTEAREGALAKLAVGLAELHGIAMTGLPEQSAQNVMDRLEAVALKRIARACPRHRDQAVRVLRFLSGRMPRKPAIAATLHGDLHVGNVLFDGRHVIFIDLDGLAAGDPCFDLAMLASRLLLLAITGDENGAWPRYLELASQLPELYMRAGGHPVDERTYNWYLAALIVGRQIKTCINHAAPHLPQRIAVLLNMAMLAARGCAISAGRFAEPAGTASEAVEALLPRP